MYLGGDVVGSITSAPPSHCRNSSITSCSVNDHTESLPKVTQHKVKVPVVRGWWVCVLGWTTVFTLLHQDQLLLYICMYALDVLTAGEKQAANGEVSRTSLSLFLPPGVYLNAVRLLSPP